MSTLKKRTYGVLATMGSSDLLRSLIAAGLTDEYLVMIHPVMLGTGRRLFPAGVHVPLKLTSSAITPTGVVIATYEPAPS